VSRPGASHRPSEGILALKTYVTCLFVAALIAVGIGLLYPVATSVVLIVLAGVASLLHLLLRPPPLPPTRHVRRVKSDQTLA